MTKTWMKFLIKLNLKIRYKLEIIIEKILNNDFDWLNIKELSWKKGYFRVRVWRIRIIFIKFEEWNIIDDIWYRWDIYKWL